MIERHVVTLWSDFMRTGNQSVIFQAWLWFVTALTNPRSEGFANR